MKNFLVQFFIVIIPISMYGQKKIVNIQTENLPGDNLCFVENVGQIIDQYGNRRDDIQYQLSALQGLSVFISRQGIHYQFSKHFPDTLLPIKTRKSKIENEDCYTEYDMYRLDVALEGANPCAEVIAEEATQYFEHYYSTGIEGDNATAHSYKRITYKNIYPDIDWVLFISGNRMGYDFVVNPGGNVDDIKIHYNGASSLQISRDDITAICPAGELYEGKLYCHEAESSKEIVSFYEVDNNTVFLKTGNYKGSLIVDPTLEWSTYYGGDMAGGDAVGRGIVADTFGNIYATGFTSSVAHIATTGAYQNVYNADCDVFLAKFQNNGVLEWATYYGGSGYDQSNNITLDYVGNLYISGVTSSSSNIATSAAHQNTYNGGGADAFIAKFSDTGTMIWASYYGGSGDDETNGIACDRAGNVYMTGFTASKGNIATPGAYKTNFTDSVDAFIAKFSNTGVLVWGTYYGGHGHTAAYNIAADNTGYIYISGYTTSPDSIATPGSYNSTYSGATDVFVARFTDSGSLSWGTYFGGSLEDENSAISISVTGDVYICGNTGSPSGIATPGAYKTYLSGFKSAYLAKFSNSGALDWATYYGGSSGCLATCLATDNAGNMYMAGTTQCPDSIATPDGFQSYLGGYQDAFITKFSPAGTPVCGTYFGADSAEDCYAIVCDNHGSIYITGETNSIKSIATANAYDTVFYGTVSHGQRSFVTFITKFDSLRTDGLPQIKGANLPFCLYPNPAKESVYVSWQNITQQDTQISIFNMQGRQLFTTRVVPAASQAAIPVSTLPTGVYVCMLQIGVSRYYDKFTVIR